MNPLTLGRGTTSDFWFHISDFVKYYLKSWITILSPREIELEFELQEQYLYTLDVIGAEKSYSTGFSGNYNSRVNKFSRSQTFLEDLWNAVFSRYSLWLETRVYQLFKWSFFQLAIANWKSTNWSRRLKPALFRDFVIYWNY